MTIGLQWILIIGEFLRKLVDIIITNMDLGILDFLGVHSVFVDTEAHKPFIWGKWYKVLCEDPKSELKKQINTFLFH